MPDATPCPVGARRGAKIYDGLSHGLSRTASPKASPRACKSAPPERGRGAPNIAYSSTIPAMGAFLRTLSMPFLQEAAVVQTSEVAMT